MDREQITEQVSNALTTIVLKGTSAVPFVKPDADEVVRKIDGLTGNSLSISRPADFFDPRLPVGALDRAAKDYTRHAQLVVTSAGLVTGAGGLVGIAPNVVSLVAATVGLVRRHALVYGFTDIEDDPDNKMPLLVGFAAATGAKAAIGGASYAMGKVAGEVAMNIAARHAAQLLLAQQISVAMAVQMIRQAALRVVPVVSSATSGALNYAFLRSAGRRSADYWRERHMLVRQTRGSASRP